MSQTTSGTDEGRRIASWIQFMERSLTLMDEMARYPVRECGEPFASIPDAMRRAGVQVRFSDTKIAGQFDRIYFIRESLIDDLVGIARDMNERGWVMKIEDGFRTKQMQTALGRTPAVFDKIVQICRRECGGGRPSTDLVFRRAKCLVANVPANGTHLCGAAVDVSIFRLDDGSEVWRGKPYLEMSEYTPMLSPFVSEDERTNRLDITAIMERHGFLHYPGEFWHYNKGDALYQMLARTGQPGRYGPVHWDPRTNKVEAYDDYLTLLTPPEQMEREIHSALARLGDA